MARKAKPKVDPRATLTGFQEYDIGCGKYSVKNMESTNIIGMYAKGSGTANYTGTVKILTESEVIVISWEKTGRPHISVYKLKEDYGIGKVEPEYFQVIDKRGHITIRWESEISPGWEPAKPKVSTYKEKARGRYKKNKA